MTDQHWQQLLRILAGEQLDPLPVGFLVDGPFIAGFADAPLMDYFTDDALWLQANLEVHQRYPDVLWLPGFWAEFGMISNPPSFGSKCVWPEDGLPTCEPVLTETDDVGRIAQPNVRSDGLLPLIIKRLRDNQTAIEQAGHRYRFAASHGPFTIAAYLLGHTEFFLRMRSDPDAVRQLLDVATQFVVDWLTYQKELFPSIDGVLVLDDFIGFVGETDFQEFALPHMTRISQTLDVSVRFLHNDAAGLITARHLEAMNVNLFNFSFEHDVDEIRALAGENATLLGNIPPRDVLALGTPDDVRNSVAQMLDSTTDKRRLIVSAGGFTPGQFCAEKIDAFCEAVR